VTSRGVLLVVVVLCLVGAALARPVLRTWAPQASVDASLVRDGRAIIHPLFDPSVGAPAPDPWGHPFRVRARTATDPARDLHRLGIYSKSQQTGPTRLLYSIGANGIDESGAGDDLYPDPSADPLVSHAVAWAPDALLAIAALAAWWLAWARVRRRSWKADAVILVALVVPPCALTAYSLVWLPMEVFAGMSSTSPAPVAVPKALAILSSVAIFSTIGALWLRLGAPPSVTPAEASAR